MMVAAMVTLVLELAEHALDEVALPIAQGIVKDRSLRSI